MEDPVSSIQDADVYPAAAAELERHEASGDEERLAVLEDLYKALERDLENPGGE